MPDKAISQKDHETVNEMLALLLNGGKASLEQLWYEGNSWIDVLNEFAPEGWKIDPDIKDYDLRMAQIRLYAEIFDCTYGPLKRRAR